MTKIVPTHCFYALSYICQFVLWCKNIYRIGPTGLTYTSHLLPISVSLQTRQIFNLFQEHMEQPFLGFRIAGEKTKQFKKPDSLENQTVFKTSGAFGAAKPVTKPVTKPLETEKV